MLKPLPLFSFDIALACGNWFLPEGALSPRLWKVKWCMVTVLCVEKVRQLSDNHVCLELRVKVTSFHIHQTPNLPMVAARHMHRFHLMSAYNYPASLKRKLRIIFCTVAIIKCWSLVFRCYIQRASSIAEAYHPLVQMLWEVFKGVWALERRNSAGFDLCCCLWWRCTGPAMALEHSTNNRSSRPPPTFIPTAPHSCLETMDTKGWGCYGDWRSILLLAGPGSRCTIVNHLPNNEP